MPATPDMVFVKGGLFRMGDVFMEGNQDEMPIHVVAPYDFYIGKNAVTFAEYDAFCDATKREKSYDRGWGRGHRPVIFVNWYSAIEYCNWLSEQEQLTSVYGQEGEEWIADWTANGYRLPTEAEWEYAARGGRNRFRFGNGKNIAVPREINFNSSTHVEKGYSETGEYIRHTVPVGSLNSPNALGLFDMSGNVSKWCWDWYGSNYYEGARKVDPKGPNSGTDRVIRGGGWNNTADRCRTTVRSSFPPWKRYGSQGVRLARYSGLPQTNR